MSGLNGSVSIALCTYNGGKYIRKQIDSYFSQTILPDEIVVCDDGSDDDTISIVKEFIDVKKEVKWLLVLNEKRLGARMNFEKAISLCHGDFIFLSDQDDIWNAEKIEQALLYFEQNPGIDASFSNASMIDEMGGPLPESLLDTTFFKPGIRQNYQAIDLFYWTLLFGNFITGATIAIRRTALRDILPFRLNLERKLWHDGWIALSLMANGRVGYIDKMLLKYRVHADQQVGVVRRNDPFQKHIFLRENEQNHIKEYFQRYLSAYSVMKKLKGIKAIDASIEEKLTKQFLNHKVNYFRSQSFPERKLRLLKWWLLGINHISWKDLVSL
jgi:glycosyltransferase involved in cell wall biosynthesis